MVASNIIEAAGPYLHDFMHCTAATCMNKEYYKRMNVLIKCLVSVFPALWNWKMNNLYLMAALTGTWTVWQEKIKLQNTGEHTQNKKQHQEHKVKR